MSDFGASCAHCHVIMCITIWDSTCCHIQCERWIQRVCVCVCICSHQPAAGVAYTHPTTVASYTVHQAPVAAHTVAAAYAPTAATVAVARPAPVAVAAAATAAAYGGYQPTHATTDYGYPQRQPEVAPPPPPVTSQTYQVPRKSSIICLCFINCEFSHNYNLLFIMQPNFVIKIIVNLNLFLITHHTTVCSKLRFSSARTRTLMCVPQLRV